MGSAGAPPAVADASSDTFEGSDRSHGLVLARTSLPIGEGAGWQRPGRARSPDSTESLRLSLTPTPKLHPILQAKLRIGTPKNEPEQEAEREADRAMQMPEPGTAQPSISPAARQSRFQAFVGEGQPLPTRVRAQAEARLGALDRCGFIPEPKLERWAIRLLSLSTSPTFCASAPRGGSPSWTHARPP